MCLLRIKFGFWRVPQHFVVAGFGKSTDIRFDCKLGDFTSLYVDIPDIISSKGTI